MGNNRDMNKSDKWKEVFNRIVKALNEADLTKEAETALHKHYADVFFDPARDVTLSAFAEDMAESCDEICDTCDVVDKKNCRIESKHAILLLMEQATQSTLDVKRIYKMVQQLGEGKKPDLSLDEDEEEDGEDLVTVVTNRKDKEKKKQDKKTGEIQPKDTISYI